jgi:serine/threonine protein kinase
VTGSELVKEIIRTLETLGKYERVVQVHEGGSAFSFKAHQKLLGRDSFIKIYDYIEGQEDSVLAEPRQLVDILRSGPKSEHIIDIYDVDILEVAGEKFVCLQMEYCQGESLLSFLRSNYLGQQDAIRIITQIMACHISTQRRFYIGTLSLLTS